MEKSSNKTKIVIHPGMPKSATTFLQWNVFHYMDINYLWHIFHKSWLKDIMDVNKEVDLQKMKEKMQNYLSNDKINLLSEENLYSNYLIKQDDRFIILERIHTIFPDAKIIFGIRKSNELLISYYKQYAATGGTLDFKNFLKKHMNLDKIDHKKYLDKLIKYYEEKNIFTYTLDEMKNNQEQIVRDICKFIGVEFPSNYKRKPTNVGYSLETLKISLFLNRFFRTDLNPKGIIPFPNYVLPQRLFFQSAIMRKLLPQTKITVKNLNELKI